MRSARSRAEPSAGPQRARSEAGAAAVEFVLVGVLLLFLSFGVIQVGLILHARNVLAAGAAEGARRAASLNVPVGSGGDVAAELARRSVPGAGRSVTCSAGARTGEGGVPIAEVRCVADLRLAFIPLGSVRLSVTGRALKEVAG